MCRNDRLWPRRRYSCRCCGCRRRLRRRNSSDVALGTKSSNGRTILWRDGLRSRLGSSRRSPGRVRRRSLSKTRLHRCRSLGWQGSIISRCLWAATDHPRQAGRRSLRTGRQGAGLEDFGVLETTRTIRTKHRQLPSNGDICGKDVFLHRSHRCPDG